MQPVLSADEFQRFQTQLLDLREASIVAQDARIRAEEKVKQLEAQINSLQGALKADSTNAVLAGENQQLRDKLIAMESSFILQVSTLKTECYRLTVEIDELREAASSVKSYRETECQTESVTARSSSAQTDGERDEEDENDALSDDSIPLRNELDLLKKAHSLCDLSFTVLHNRINHLETLFSTTCSDCQQIMTNLRQENVELSNQLANTQFKLDQAFETEAELRSQLKMLQKRSGVLNRDLKRQLSRLVNTHRVDSVNAEHSLDKTFSSSVSSLASNPVSPRVGGSVVMVNGDSLSNLDEAKSFTDQTVSVSSSMSDSTCGNAPPGFFSMSDIKTLIDRMSHVQEDNCVLRRQVQRLQVDLSAKSRALQFELNKQLLGDSAPPTSTIHNLTSNSPVPSLTPSKLPVSPTSSGVPTFPFLNLSWPSRTATADSSTKLSAVNVDTVNRLKLMCEQLMTQNIKLMEELDQVRMGRGST